MRTAYCPKSHADLASVSVGSPYGHVPGHQYGDADCLISRARNGTFRCHLVWSYGSAQGYDEEHGRTEVIGRGDSIHEAVVDCRHRVKETDLADNQYVPQALSQAEDEAEEATDD